MGRSGWRGWCATSGLRSCAIFAASRRSAWVTQAVTRRKAYWSVVRCDEPWEAKASGERAVNLLLLELYGDHEVGLVFPRHAETLAPRWADSRCPGLKSNFVISVRLQEQPVHPSRPHWRQEPTTGRTARTAKLLFSV